MAYPELLVLRHGQTEWNAAGRHQGQLDSPLTALGHQQAAAQREILRRFDLSGWRAACSPSVRAVQTAASALKDTGLIPKYDKGLREVHFGAWQGLTSAAIAAQWPALDPELHEPLAWNFMSPGGEDFSILAARAKAVLNALTGPTVIVIYGIFSRVLRGLWLGVGFDAMRELGGGQGAIYHMQAGRQAKLEAEV